jgi:hypothetical protein
MLVRWTAKCSTGSWTLQCRVWLWYFTSVEHTDPLSALQSNLYYSFAICSVALPDLLHPDAQTDTGTLISALWPYHSYCLCQGFDSRIKQPQSGSKIKREKLYYLTLYIVWNVKAVNPKLDTFFETVCDKNILCSVWWKHTNTHTQKQTYKHTNTHTHTYIYIYTYMYIYHYQYLIECILSQWTNSAPSKAASDGAVE